MTPQNSERESHRLTSLWWILAIVLGFFALRVLTGWADTTTTVLYLGASLVLIYVVWRMHNQPPNNDTVVATPSMARWLFEDRHSSWFWLLVRLFLGTEWLNAGLHKVTDPGWIQTGEALRGYWERAVAIPESGRPAITYDWYRTFLQSLLDSGSYTWFAKLVAVGEVLVGVALILGLFVGFAAFFGGFMNFNFMLAGSASTNPVLFIAAIGLIMAWKVAGYWGLDAFVMPAIGVPGQPGWLFRQRT